MKNVFKFFGLALVAGAMLTSCGGDENKFEIIVNTNDATMGTVDGGGKYEANETATLTATPKEGYKFVSWQDGNKENPRTITVTANATYTATFESAAVADGINVTFGTNAWTAAGTTKYYVQNGCFVQASANADGVSFPVFVLQTTTVNPGTYTDVVNANYGYDNGNINVLDYYDQTALQSSDGSSTYGDWWAKTVNFTINSFDATSLHISANVSSVMFHALQLTEGVAAENADTQNLTISINTTLEAYTGKALTNNKKNFTK